MASGKREKLVKLKKIMAADDSLPLKAGATKLVFGAGNSDAEIMFIGEGPGRWEDMKGIPFVGNAGKFLSQLIELTGLKRPDVFITNVVNHRPPENRDPTPDEINAYAPYIDKMIDIIEPKIMVTLGRFSMAKFMPGVFISKVHGVSKTVDWKGRKILIVPMYHPAAGLRNGNVKEMTKSDFLTLKELLTNYDKITKAEDGKKEDKSDEEEKVEQTRFV